MSPHHQFAAEINALRYQLLGRGESMLGATQYACRHYLGILTRMSEHGGTDTQRLSDMVNDIYAGLDRLELYPDERRKADVLQKSMTELRMIIDMHLHTLNFDASY